MTSIFRITSGLIDQLHGELSRRHKFAAERVVFLTCRTGKCATGGILLLAHSMHPVADEDYEPSMTMGALIGGGGFRKILQYLYANDVSVFHVHRHEHDGPPMFSAIDVRESAKFVPDFFKVRPRQPHGTLVLSHDSIYGHVWRTAKSKPERIDRFIILGHHLRDERLA
jgi:hypothetical protein